jgi:isopentenyldiphosphate isomerase
MVVDNPQELFAQVDINDELLGLVTRDYAHRNPKIIHRAVTILVFDQKNRILLQQRSNKKGHVSKFLGSVMRWSCKWLRHL